jgi:hypothetical protein
MIYTARDIELFWAKVRRGNDDECWPWQGSLAVNGGYGLFDRRRDGERLSVRAHRLAYELLVGQIPDGAMLRHDCDNPPCVNPKHLTPGTAKDNSQDMVARGRHWTHQRPHDVPRGEDHWTATRGTNTLPRGEGHPNAKLSASDVKEIRRQYAGKKLSQRALAEKYGVSQGTVWQIVNGNYWRNT